MTRTTLARQPGVPEDYMELLIHRLSQPITALQGSLEVALLTGESVKDQKDALQTALQQAIRIAKIIEDLRENQDVVN